MAHPFFTIGHSTRSIGSFLGLLKDTQVWPRTVPRSCANAHHRDVLARAAVRPAPILLTVTPVYRFTCDWSPAGRFVDCNAARSSLSRSSPTGRNRRAVTRFVWTHCPQSLRFCITRLHSLLADGKERQATARRRRASAGERRVFQRLLPQTRRLTLLGLN